MKIKSVTIKGFRGYSDAITINFKDLCVLVGKNDIGKSTVLEALDIFFNDGKGCVKIDKEDINKANLGSGNKDIEISVEFDHLPSSILIDATNSTSLADEHLLTSDGTLQVVKRYPNAGTAKVFIKCFHPTNQNCKDLHLSKNKDLKTLLDNQGLACTDKTKNAELRKSIWAGQADLQLDTIEIEVSKIDQKSIWDQLKINMPLYTLFQSDRKNSDGDSEVQDPMKLAVKQILSNAQIQADLKQIADTVKQKLDEVVTKTLEKLSEMNPDIAASLDPKLPESDSLKWQDVFKGVSISGDDDIPINKRGSGVKRLILLNFFRAEAERRQSEENLPNIVFAIEEPETSQHPEHQRVLIDALKDLSTTNTAQVILTTHSPEIVKRLAFENLLLIKGQQPEDMIHVEPNELPYPSLNEVNYSAFDEATEEYHNELYGFIDEEGEISTYSSGKITRPYNKIQRNGSIRLTDIPLTEYIRHQIHHPENQHNTRFTRDELKRSIEDMRSFIESDIRGTTSQP